MQKINLKNSQKKGIILNVQTQFNEILYQNKILSKNTYEAMQQILSIKVGELKE